MTDIAARLGGIFEWLRRAVAAHGGLRQNWADVPLVVLLWGRIGRTARRLDALLAMYRAGTLPPVRVRAPRAPSATPAADRKPRPRLPTRFNWFGAMAPQARAFGTQLEFLLTDPEMIAFVQAVPQAGRLLRPVLWMLGVKPSQTSLPPPPTRPKRRKAPGSPPSPDQAPSGPTAAIDPTGPHSFLTQPRSRRLRTP